MADKHTPSNSQSDAPPAEHGKRKAAAGDVAVGQDAKSIEQFVAGQATQAAQLGLDCRHGAFGKQELPLQ